MIKKLATAIAVLMTLTTSIVSAQINVATVKPTIGNIKKLLQFTGETRPLVESFAAADVTGPVSQIMVEEGQKVQQNQALGKIDEIRFAISLRQMEAALERAKQQLVEGEIDLERNKTLFDRKAITQKSLDMAQTTYIKAKTTLKQSQADYDKAKLDLERCVIRAPISGYFIDRAIELGQAMARGQNMGKVIDLDHVYVDARIPESEIRNIRIGQECMVEDVYPGTVQHINLYADSSRSFKVRIKVKNPDLYFKGNMFVKGQITLEEYNDVPLFPSQAIRNYRGDQYVFVVKNGKAEKINITIVAQYGENTYAREIEPNTEIVTIGQDNLENGSEIALRNGNSQEKP
jgi:RND family efflux transporter MFP subunit